MMAATVNTNASAGEALGGPHAPPRRTSTPPWNQILRGPGIEGMVDPPPHSPAAPSAEELVYRADGYEAEYLPGGCDNGSGSTKPAWNKPYDAALDGGVVMGAVSWPTLSESANAPLKLPLADSSVNPHDSLISVQQSTAATANESSSVASPEKQMIGNPSKPIPNATQHHGRPARQKSMRREGGSSSLDGGFSQSSSVGDISHSSPSPLKTSSGGSSSSVRDHGHNNVARESTHRSGGDRPQQRNYRRSNSGPHLRGDGSFGGRRDQDRRNHDWNHQRSFNGRDSVMPPQRVSPSGFIRPPPPVATTYIPPPPIPYGGGLMGIPPEMQPLYYVAPYPGMPFVAQMPPAVYYPPVPLDSQLYVKIINQIDYYFSNDNLIKDTYLRKNMDEYGWVPIQLIANFKKVMQLTTDIQLILDAVRASTVVEVQGDKIRKRDDWMRWIMPSSAQFPTTSSSQYPRVLQDTRPAHVQGLTLEENLARLQL